MQADLEDSRCSLADDFPEFPFSRFKFRSSVGQAYLCARAPITLRSVVSGYIDERPGQFCEHANQP